MSGNNFIVDTNIALYLLSGHQPLIEILEGSQLYVSFVTELELLGYAGITARDQLRARAFLDDCIIADINEEIKKHTIHIRQKYRIKLPDSIIAATSLFLEIPLLTADKGFKKIAGLELALFEK